MINQLSWFYKIISQVMLLWNDHTICIWLGNILISSESLSYRYLPSFPQIQISNYNVVLYSLSGKSSYCCQISWSLEAARLDVLVFVLLWYLTDTPATLLPKCLSNFRANGKVQIRISRLRDLTRSCGKRYYCLMRYCLLVNGSLFIDIKETQSSGWIVSDGWSIVIRGIP